MSFHRHGIREQHLVPAPLLGAYNASKHAVLGLTETLELETPDFFGVSILCPALVATNIAESLTRIPEGYGGPVAVPAGAGGGASPEQVADSTLAGVQSGDFYIFSHHCNQAMIEARMNRQLGTQSKNRRRPMMAVILSTPAPCWDDYLR